MGNEFVLRRNSKGIISVQPVSFKKQKGGFFQRFKENLRFNGVCTTAIPAIKERAQPIALFHKKPRHKGAQEILAQITVEMQYYDVDWNRVKKLSEMLFEKKQWVFSGNLNIRRAPKYRSDALDALLVLASGFCRSQNSADDKRLELLGILAGTYARLVQPSVSQNPLTDVFHGISNWAELHKGGYYSKPLAQLAISLKEKYGGAQKQL